MSNSPDEDTNGVGGEEPAKVIDGITSNLHKLFHSIWNIELLDDARKSFSEADWFVVSRTTFYLGIVVLSGWSLFWGFVLLLNFILSSPDAFEGLYRAFQVSPFIPVLLFLFAVISSWAAKRLHEREPRIRSPKNRAGVMQVFVISLVALVVAGTMRWVIYQIAIGEYGFTLTIGELTILILLDGGYLSLLLIGLGGIGSISFDSNPN